MTTTIQQRDRKYGVRKLRSGLPFLLFFACLSGPSFAQAQPVQGSVKVSISPAGAVNAGAQWQVDGGEWQASGATVSGLSVGTHSLTFKTLSGWTTPTAKKVTIAADTRTTASGTYSRGGLLFTINADAVTITITGYTGDGGAVVIPGAINGRPVTAVGAQTFQANQGLTSVTIPEGVTSIGASAFAGCSALTSVIIAEGVTSIGNSAFNACSALTSVIIPASVTSIGDMAFYGCSSLGTAWFEGEAPGAGQSVFDGTEPLFEIHYPVDDKASWATTPLNQYQNEPIQYVGGNSPFEFTLEPQDAADAGARWRVDLFQWLETFDGLPVTPGAHLVSFETVSGWEAPQSLIVDVDSTGANGSATYQPGFFYTVDASGVTVTGFNGPPPDVLFIPASMPGVGNVVAIGANAFQGSSLTCVTIAEGVTSIGDSAFQGSSLTCVAIPASVTSIGANAFQGSSLTCVTIAEGVTSIGDSAFDGCPGLTSVIIPASVTSIGNSAFGDCGSLTSINVDQNNPTYSSVGGLLADKPGKTLIECPCGIVGAYTVPGGFTSIGDYAFDGCSGLTSVTIPNSVTSVGDYAFYGCSGLTSVTISDSITSIADWSFANCSGLTSVTIPNSVTSIGNAAFAYCSGLIDVTIPGSVTFIGDSAFYACSGLTSVTIPDKVASIEGNAFNDCAALVEAIFQGSAPGVFGGDVFLDTALGFTVYYYYSPQPTGFTTPTWNGYPAQAYQTTSDGWEYWLHGSAATILGYAGAGGAVAIPDTIKDVPVTSIGDSAFSGCSSLTSVAIPNSVNEIGSSAFSGCSGLTSVTLPNSVTSIADWSFAHCSGLTSVTIPNSITSIGNAAFAYCSGLIDVTIPASVTSIGDSAFYACSGLTSVTIPAGVTSIYDNAFNDCAALGEAIFQGGAPGVFGGDVFIDTASGFRVYYNPSDAAEFTTPTWNGYPAQAYQTTSDGWEYWSDGSAATILGYAGAGGAVAIPDTINGASVTAIAAGAFAGNSGLTAIYISKNVTSVGDMAFAGCSGLTSAFFQGAAPTTFGNQVFDGCAPGFTVYYPQNANGWSTPAWKTYNAMPWLVPLQVTLSPPDAVNAGAQWQVDNDGNWHNSGDTVPNLSPGDHTVTFNAVSGWTTPENLLVTIGAGGAFVTSAPYQPGFFYTVDAAGVTITGYNGTPPNSLTIPGSIPGVAGSVTAIGDNAFNDDNLLTTVTLPDSLKTIGAWAFAYCGLSGVTLPGGLTTIQQGAFAYCFELTSINIPQNVTSIDPLAFEWDWVLGAINVDPNNPAYSSSADGVLFNKKGTVLVSCPPNFPNTYNIPSGVTSIGDYAFYGCANLFNVSIPDSVTSIGAHAFESAGLVGLTLPKNLAAIGDLAFAGNFMTVVTIPASVTSIGQGPFEDCQSLVYLNVDPSNPAYRGSGGILFSKDGTTLVQFPPGIRIPFTYIVPASVTSIGGYAFLGCCGVSDVVIPGTVTSIGDRAFNGCVALMSAHFEGDPPSSFGASVFDQTFFGFSIYYPSTASLWTTPAWGGYSAQPYYGSLPFTAGMVCAESFYGVGQLIAVSDLLAQVSAGPATFVSVGTDGQNSLSGFGSTLFANASFVLYSSTVQYTRYAWTGAETPTPVAMDTFKYTVQDSQGNTAKGTVIIPLMYGNLVGQTTPRLTHNPNNTITATFFGVPGYQYTVERATDLQNPTWVAIGAALNSSDNVITAPDNGVMQVVDDFSDLGGIEPGSAFYHLRYQPQ